MRLTKHFHNWFIPHHGNDHHPHVLRPHGLGALAATVIGIQLVFNFMVAGQFQILGYATNINTSDLLAYTNQHRRQAGVAPLQLHSQLNQGAYAKAQDMLRDQYWAHTAPDGTQPWYFFTQAGYEYQSAGENLAKNFQTSAGVVDGWMGSAGHRQNVLDSGYQHVGFAVVNGTLQGEETTLVVAFYGDPKPAPSPTPIASSQPAPPPPAPAPPPEPAPAPQPEPEPRLEPEPEPEPRTEPQPRFDFDGSSVAVIAPLERAPEPQTYRPSSILSLRDSLGWGQFATIWLLSIVGLVSVGRHTAIWHHQRKGMQHIWFRSHPLAQAGLLFAASAMIIISSFGVVG